MYHQQTIWNWKEIRKVNYLYIVRKTMGLKLIPEGPLF